MCHSLPTSNIINLSKLCIFHESNFNLPAPYRIPNPLLDRITRYPQCLPYGLLSSSLESTSYFASVDFLLDHFELNSSKHLSYYVWKSQASFPCLLISRLQFSAWGGSCSLYPEHTATLGTSPSLLCSLCLDQFETALSKTRSSTSSSSRHIATKSLLWSCIIGHLSCSPSLSDLLKLYEKAHSHPFCKI